MRFGLLGLGRMGGHLALHAVEKGHSVVAYDPRGIPEQLQVRGIEDVRTFQELVKVLTPPRLVIAYVPHGPSIERVCAEMRSLLEPGDIFIDGGNSHWKVSMRHAVEMKRVGVRFLDVGTSGGVEGARHGACFMVGGDEDAFNVVEPLLRDLAVPDGVAYLGAAGAGHFAKLIHNAIEFGMVQAIAEGVELLERSEFHYDLPLVFHNWAHGSVIRGWLIELMEHGLRKYPDFERLSPYVEDTREVKWAVEFALDHEVWAPVTAESEMAFYRYRDADSITAKAVALIRNGFGGHPVHFKQEAESQGARGEPSPAPH